MHRDVKPDNILISATQPVQMKLSDFGLCKKVSPQGTFSQSGLKGTLNWMAPEMLQIMNDAPDELPHGSTQSDTFAAGCVFFYFTTRGSHPFGNPTFVLANIYNNNPVALHNYAKSMFLKNKNYLKSSNENCILVPELNEDDLLGKCLCTLIGKMLKTRGERIELTEVIKN